MNRRNVNPISQANLVSFIMRVDYTGHMETPDWPIDIMA